MNRFKETLHEFDFKKMGDNVYIRESEEDESFEDIIVYIKDNRIFSLTHDINTTKDYILFTQINQYIPINYDTLSEKTNVFQPLDESLSN